MYHKIMMMKLQRETLPLFFFKQKTIKRRTHLHIKFMQPKTHKSTMQLFFVTSVLRDFVFVNNNSSQKKPRNQTPKSSSN